MIRQFKKIFGKLSDKKNKNIISSKLNCVQMTYIMICSTAWTREWARFKFGEEAPHTAYQCQVISQTEYTRFAPHASRHTLRATRCATYTHTRFTPHRASCTFQFGDEDVETRTWEDLAPFIVHAPRTVIRAPSSSPSPPHKRRKLSSPPPSSPSRSPITPPRLPTRRSLLGSLSALESPQSSYYSPTSPSYGSKHRSPTSSPEPNDVSPPSSPSYHPSSSPSSPESSVLSPSAPSSDGSPTTPSYRQLRRRLTPPAPSPQSSTIIASSHSLFVRCGLSSELYRHYSSISSHTSSVSDKIRNAIVAITLPEMFEVLFSLQPEFKKFTFNIARALFDQCELDATEACVVRSFLDRFDM